MMEHKNWQEIQERALANIPANTPAYNRLVSANPFEVASEIGACLRSVYNPDTESNDPAPDSNEIRLQAADGITEAEAIEKMVSWANGTLFPPSQ